MKKLSWFLLFICLAHPLFAQVAAHKTVTLQVDADANGKVTPGDTLRYTIVITNTSSTNLLNVQFNDAGFQIKHSWPAPSRVRPSRGLTVITPSATRC